MEQEKRLRTPLEKLLDLNLPDGEFMVMGSGILSALNIREAKDADVVVRHAVYKQLKDSGWQERIFRSGSIEQYGLERDVFQIFYNWTDSDGLCKTLDELLTEADVVQGIAYNSLDKLYAYKVRRGLEKDLTDLRLIDEYKKLA